MPRRRSRRSGRLWVGTALADGRWWHHFPGQGAPGGDHDQSPVTGADREGMAVMLLENAHDVGDLLAIIWAGPAPADNDPLTDVGRSEPDLEPVAHAGHLFRGAAPGAAAGLATTPSAADDVAGEVAGVIRQQTGLGSAGDPSWPENLTFSVVNWAHWPGASSWQKIASTGHAGSQAPQSTHSPGGCSASARLRRCNRPGIHRRRSCP